VKSLDTRGIFIIIVIIGYARVLIIGITIDIHLLGSRKGIWICLLHHRILACSGNRLRIISSTAGRIDNGLGTIIRIGIVFNISCAISRSTRHQA
jgi:hypothetical protein